LCTRICAGDVSDFERVLVGHSGIVIQKFHVFFFPPDVFSLFFCGYHTVVGADEGAATVAIFGKYFLILTLGVGVSPVLRDKFSGFKGGGEVKMATR